MYLFERNPESTHKTNSTMPARPGRASSGKSPEVRPLLHLQHTIGNQAVQRLLQAKTDNLKASPAGDAATTQTEATDAGQSVAPPVVHEAMRSSGRPLDSSTLAYFEPRFAYDFGEVRVHTDEKAAESARAVNARAYTVGHDIVFAAGQYRPQESEGRRLLAHELTHVRQQSAQSALSLQRQTPPTTTIATHSDAVVQALIDEALARNATVEEAFRDLQARRCLPESCGDENLAAAEHYMFARHQVQDSMLPPEMMALVMAGAISAYQVVKMLGLFPSFCPEICPVTPPSVFQWSWAIRGVEDGLIIASIPRPPL